MREQQPGYLQNLRFVVGRQPPQRRMSAAGDLTGLDLSRTMILSSLTLTLRSAMAIDGSPCARAMAVIESVSVKAMNRRTGFLQSILLKAIVSQHSKRTGPRHNPKPRPTESYNHQVGPSRPPPHQ